MSFKRMTPEEMHEYLLQQGFLRVRQLADDSWIGVLKLAFTTSVCMDIDEVSHSSMAGVLLIRMRRITFSRQLLIMMKCQLSAIH
ncbi:hypothetical protein [Klebsiella quasipneumoniae]|uniref:hypothetical protein n=1 Tax=Klebsiella quasipneumoniae TaxID=1463165 RepID=UPI00296451E6|nr:hypothetical protein [Klebsiella quasipneumoniae]